MSDSAALAQAIGVGGRALGLELSAQAIAKLVTFIEQLTRWNRVYNLTAVRQPEAMVTHHILDSLTILPWLRGARVLDVGSGAGLPGIPLAIANPALQFILLDSNAKRCRFMMQMIAELQLTNVEVVRSRVEDYRPQILFDSIISRAFASLVDWLRVCQHLCAPGGRFLAMKGSYPEAELESLAEEFRLLSVESLRVPGLDAKRHVLLLEPVLRVV